MKFVQTIEYQTTNIDEMQKLVDEYRTATEGRNAVIRGLLCQDRDRPNTYLTVVEFPSYEEAMKNSEMAETTELSQKIQALCDGPPVFRNLDLVREMEG